ncbi:PhzF family phenazine biosynthesis protein [uncultured Jatrophihabitans sp.]|uniref:PhzF family phenazine biosynthesis protein n=1 Tax=uncultured Jatrophihabitans sp. TaxID=1610747 RepID=UPI0035C97B96
MLRFTQVDVFADELTFGNAVAVVHDADPLDTEQMAAFARWTNLSETTFLCRPSDPAADYRLRIFTPARELPFAGHPTLGSARAWLTAGGTPRSPGEVIQECGIGLVRLRRDGARFGFAAPQLIRGGPVDPAGLPELAGGLGVDVAEIVAAQWVDNGPGWVAVLLADADRVLALKPDPRAFGRFSNIGVVGPHPDGAETAFEVRAFVGGDSPFEDPVTGSLNAALGQWLIESGRAPQSYVASQGTRIGRRGRVHVEQVDGEVWVSGATTIGVSGAVALP